MPSLVVPLNTAINGMASLLGITPVSSKYFARLLREDGHGMWPEVGRGRRSGTARVSDLVNLWMAVVLSEGQPNDCPRAVREFHLLRVVQMEEIAPAAGAHRTEYFSRNRFYIDDPKTQADTRPLHLSSQFCRLVEMTALDIISGQPSGSDEPDWPEFCITLGSGSSPMFATATWRDKHDDPKNKFSVDEYSTSSELLPGLWLPYARLNKLARTQVLIGRDELLALAGFLANAGKIETDPNSPTAPGSVEKGNPVPDTKKAPGTGIHEGLQTERPAPKAQTRSPHKKQSATGKGRKQSLRPSGAGFDAGQESTPYEQEPNPWLTLLEFLKAPGASSAMCGRLTA